MLCECGLSVLCGSVWQRASCPFTFFFFNKCCLFKLVSNYLYFYGDRCIKRDINKKLNTPNLEYVTILRGGDFMILQKYDFCMKKKASMTVHP